MQQIMPTFKLHDAYASAHATVRDLLTHRTGLPRHDLAWYKAPISRRDLFLRLQYFKPTKSFREAWQYSNLMYMAAGVLVEHLSGQPWETFVQQRLLLPLGMTRTNFSVHDSQQTPDFALPYSQVHEQIQQLPFYDRFQAVAPAGAINSNVEDMSKWLLFLLNKGRVGEHQVISEARMAQLFIPQMVIPDPREFTEFGFTSYGPGWVITTYRGKLMLHHGGDIDGFAALVTLLPDENVGIVVLSNASGSPARNVLTYSVCDRLLGLDEVPWQARIKQQYEQIMAVAKQSAQKRWPLTVVSTAGLIKLP